MKKILLTVCTLLLTGVAIAQSSRIVKGYVQTMDGTPLKGAIVMSTSDNVKTISSDGGAFEITISPYTTHLEASMERYLPAKAEIDGSYVVIRLKVDKKYDENKAKAEYEKALVVQREAEAKAKEEEQKRLAAQKEAEAKALAAKKEAEAKAKAAAKAEEQKRLAAQKEAEAKVKLEEQKRLADLKVTAAKEKAEEQKRLAAQKEAAKATREQLAKDAAEKRRKEYAKKQSGFGSIVDVSYMPYMAAFDYRYPSFGVNYTAGYRFNNQIYLGAGVGANLNMNGGLATRSVTKLYNSNYLSPCLISVPVFVYFRANFIDRRCSPFFAVSAGANLSAKQTLALDLYEVKYSTNGAFINPQLGVNFRTTTKTSVYLSLGFQCFTAPTCISYTGYSATIKSALGYGLDFHFGFTF